MIKKKILIKRYAIILFLTICSLFIFSSSVKAVSNAPVSPDYLDYFNVNFKNDLNSNHSKYFHKFYNLFEANKNEYPYYMIIYEGNNPTSKFSMYVFDKIPNYFLYYYGATSGGIRQMFYHPYDEAPNFTYRRVDVLDTLSSSSSNFSWITIYSSYIWASIVVFDSNFPIQLISSYNSCGGCSGRTGVDLKIDNLYYTYGDIIPTYSEYDPTIKKMYYSVDPEIDFTYTNNTTTINEIDYITSKDVTFSVKNFDSEKHLLQYQFVEKDKNLTENWITHAFANNNNTLKLNYKKNGSLYVRILDITNNYEFLTANTFTFDDIEVVNLPVSIDFNFKNNSIVVNNENRVISKDLTISLNNYDRDKHIFQYQIVKEGSSLTENWITHTFYNNHILVLNIKENCEIYTRVLDKDNNIISNNTFLINDIYNTLKLNKIYNSGEVYGNDLYSLNITNFNTNSLNYDIPFRIQFGSNDFSDNYPLISSFRGYYYNTTTQEKVLDNNVYIKNFVCNKTTASETICEGILTKNSNKPTYYEIIFANTDNYYLYYYDYLDNSYRNVDITTNLFKDYNKYYFNNNSNQAYISLNNINQTNKKGSLIIPYYFINNDYLNVKLRKFNLKDNSFGSEYSPYFLNDKYYKRFDFEINDNYIPVLTNKKGTYCNTYYVNSEDIFDIASGYNGYFLNFNNDKLYTIFNSIELLNFSLYSKDTICYKEELVYFYLHKDFKITFNEIDSSNNIAITDNNGNIIIDIDSSVNSEVLYDNDKSFFDSVKESFEYFSTPFREIFNMISYFWNLLAMPFKFLFIFVFIIVLALFIFKFIL